MTMQVTPSTPAQPKAPTTNSELNEKESTINVLMQKTLRMHDPKNEREKNERLERANKILAAARTEWLRQESRDCYEAERPAPRNLRHLDARTHSGVSESD